MARQCKCNATGEIGTVDTFVKINGKYYKSQEVYDKHVREQEFKKKVTDTIITDLLNLTEEDRIPTYIFKRYKDYKLYGYEILWETIRRSNAVANTLNKNIKTRNGKINYFFAIIDNNIADVRDDFKAENKRLEQSMNKTDSELENMIEIDQTHRVTKDISEFL